LKESVLILTSRSVGIGYLCLPGYLYNYWGYIAVLLLLCHTFFGVISNRFIYLMSSVSENLGSFQQIAYYITGRRSVIYLITLIVLIMYAFLPCIYFIVIGSIVKILLGELVKSLGSSETIPEHADKGVMLIVAIGFCFTLKKMEFQSFIVYTKVFAGFIIAFLGVFFASLFQPINLDSLYKQPLESSENHKITNWLMLFPALCFAFCFQLFLLPVHSASIKKKDDKGVYNMKPSIYSLIITCLFYLFIIGCISYANHA